jgi:hypothetical protein
LTEWRSVPGYDGYQVSLLGEVKNIKTGNVLKGWWHKTPSGSRYRCVDLSPSGKEKSKEVHILVCLAFHGMPLAGQEVCHNDGNSENNLPTNLRWGSRLENIQDQILHGKHVQARKTHCPNNHEYNKDNTYFYKNERQCRICKSANHDLRMIRVKA